MYPVLQWQQKINWNHSEEQGLIKGYSETVIRHEVGQRKQKPGGEDHIIATESYLMHEKGKKPNGTLSAHGIFIYSLGK